MVGALDMGGSSNQLVIYNGTNRSEKMKDSHFWSHSWLRYGAELVRERLLKHIYDSHTAAASASASAAAITTSAATEGLVDASSSSKANSTQQVLYLHNPCANLDYYDVYTENCIFVGTGHARDCLSQLERIIWSEEEDIGALKENLLHLAAHNSDTKFAADSLEADKTEAEKEADIEVALESSSATVEGIFEGGGEGEEGGGGGLSGHHIPGPSRCVRGPCPIDSVVHPSVAGQHFYAMSVYFYALDCVRELGPEPLPHWLASPFSHLLICVLFAHCHCLNC